MAYMLMKFTSVKGLGVLLTLPTVPVKVGITLKSEKFSSILMINIYDSTVS